MRTVVEVIYILGVMFTPLVLRVRAGLGAAERLPPQGPGGVGLAFTAKAVWKTFLWPLVLSFWICSGMPPSKPRLDADTR